MRTFGADPVRGFATLPVAGFAVDRERRIIEGVALPYGRTATKYGIKFRFAPGSLKWTDVGRVKLLRDHDMTKPVGVATNLVDAPDGLHARFRIARGPAGDEALALAEDGVLDGLSVGVDFDQNDTTLGAEDELVVGRADLREVSLTALPAFDDARLTHVAASREGTGMQPEQNTEPQGQPVAPATAPAAVTFSPEQLRALAVAFATGRPAATPAAQPEPEPERPFVDPTARAIPGQAFTRQRPAAPDAHPLAFTPAVLDALQAAIDDRGTARFIASDPRATFATLGTGTLGAPRAWGANVLRGPRMLHLVAGVPTQSVEAVLAQFPKLTLPTAQAAAGEGESVTEFAASATGSVTAGRFGRWTDLTGESQFGTDAAAIIAMHQLGIALDLDEALIGLVETAAGSAVAFADDIPAQIRTAMSKVMANTAADDPANLVILTHPDNAALLQDVSPTGGATMGERFQRFSGALVYPSNSVTTGTITVANLLVGARYFQARGAQTFTDVNVKTEVQTVATALVGGFGVTLTTGFAVTQAVVDAA